MCVSTGPLWHRQKKENAYRAVDSEQNAASKRKEGKNRGEKRVKQVGSIERKLTARLILSALLLYKRL